MFLIGFPILSQPIRPHSSTSIEYTKTWQAKPIKFITKLYPDHNNLWIKHATHQKAEFLRAGFLSKLENTVNNNSISNTKYAEFSTEWNVLLNYRSHTCVYNHLFNLHQESVPLLQSTFTSLFHPYLFTKLSLQSPVTLPSSISQKFFISLFLPTTISTTTPEIFSLPQSFSQFRLHERTRKLGSLWWIDTLLIFPFFLKVWTGLTTTDSLSPGLIKLVRCR